MKKIYAFIIGMMLLGLMVLDAQTITNVEAVYGGRINAITSSSVVGSIDSANIFITTESANSAFYAKAKGVITGSMTISSFTKMPALTASANVGSNISKIAAYSSYLYFVNAENKIQKTAFNSSSQTLFRSFGADTSLNDFMIKNGRMWFFFKVFSSNQDRFGYSDLDANGDITNFVSSNSYNNVTYPAKSAMSYKLSDSILAFKEGTDPELTILTNMETGTAAFIHDALTTLSSSVYWKCAAVAPDGKIFIGGSDGTTKYVAYRDGTTSTWTVVNTSIAGTHGTNIAFYEGLLGNYHVYFGSAYSPSKGVAASWVNFGNVSLETHSNDGTTYTLAFGLVGGVILLTTDQGIGWSKNSGSSISEIDDGIEAVQVNDFDMRSDKDFGWLASKAGIRYVRNYNTSSKAWSSAMFPNGDGSPYYSAEMVGNDSNSAYVGNVRVYKTTSKGSSWSQVFTAESAPYNFPQVGSQVTALAVSDSVNNIVMAGYKVLGSQRGGVFYSTNGGSSWSQLLLNASVNGQDVDVNDIEITSDSGKVVAYIGVDYDNTTSPIIRGMYKAQWNGASWTVRAENIYSPSTSLITINDIIIVSRDTIAATGGFYNPVYTKEYGINFMISRHAYNSWTSYVPSVARTAGFTACAWNGDTLFYAYRDSIFYSRISFNSTGTATPGEALYAKVATGTEINVLYYDELLAGCGTNFSSLKGALFTLPMKITSFTASQKQKDISIQWTNDSDEDVSQYQLQYSCNGSSFDVLANIASTKNKSYVYADKNDCTTGYRYYRLMITDKSGRAEYSSIIRVGTKGNIQLQLYPNPATAGSIQLQIAFTGISSIKVFDIAGRERINLQKNIQGFSTLDISQLQKGTYFIQIINGNEKVSNTFLVQ
jgi:hypothetical protein